MPVYGVIVEFDPRAAPGIAERLAQVENVTVYAEREHSVVAVIEAETFDGLARTTVLLQDTIEGVLGVFPTSAYLDE